MQVSLFIKFLHTFALPTAFAGADWPYRSRPDLYPPKLNITVPANESTITPGYLFIGQYAGFGDGAVGPEQPGGYIFRNDGELVWSSQSYLAGCVSDFRPYSLPNGQQILHAFLGVIPPRHVRFYGQHVLLNDRYEVVKAVVPRNHRLGAVHEFNIIDGKSVLIETPVPTPANLTKYGGDQEQGWILSSGFQELDLETGELLFEWHSLNHVDPSYTALPLTSGAAGTGHNWSDPWNYFHINSVDKNAAGDYLISARNYAALFKISGTDGTIIWQLGGAHPARSSFSIPADAHFAYQHNARFVPAADDPTTETLTLFDNAAHTALSPPLHPSRGLILQLNHTSRAATLLRTQPAPDNLSAKSQGSAQLLQNGHVFINWGEAGAVSEFGGDDSLLFHAYLDSAPAGRRVQSYRATKSNWTGKPTEEPALVVLGGVAYVSWNGDTEVREWRVWGVGRLWARLVGVGGRRGFETVVGLEGLGGWEARGYFAEGVDGEGGVLVRSKVVPPDTFLMEGAGGAAFDGFSLREGAPLVEQRGGLEQVVRL